MKPKFKVGDKVKVLRASTEEEHDLWMDTWMPSMNDAIGKVCTIRYCDSNDYWNSDTKYPKYHLKEYNSNFPEFVLQSKIQIGQQLLFDFAKEE